MSKTYNYWRYITESLEDNLNSISNIEKLTKGIDPNQACKALKTRLEITRTLAVVREQMQIESKKIPLQIPLRRPRFLNAPVAIFDEPANFDDP